MSSSVNRGSGVSFTDVSGILQLCQKCQFCLVRIIITLYSLRVFFLIISWSAWVRVYSCHASIVLSSACQVHVKCISSVSSVCQAPVKYMSSICQMYVNLCQ